MHKLGLLLLLWSVFASAKKKQQQPGYDHIGRIVYHVGQVRSIRYSLEGRTDIYHSDEYECTPGTEHYSPTCKPHNEWYVPTGIPDVPDTVDVFLDDSEFPDKPASITCTQPSTNVICTDAWKMVFMENIYGKEILWLLRTDNPKEWTFRYRPKGREGVEVMGLYSLPRAALLSAY